MPTQTVGAIVGPTTEPADQSGPNIKSSDYLAMEQYWTMVATILAGAQAMRDAGERFLPRFQNEKKNTIDPSGASYDPYEIRRSQAPFTNIYEDIGRNLASKPFSKQVEMDPATPDEYKKLAESIDGRSQNLHVFCEEVFRFGVDYAVTWILIDFTRSFPRDDGLPLSVVEERQQGLRPYWVHVPWSRMLAVYNDYIGGVEVITHARVYEPTVVLNGFVERRVQRVRVMNREPDAWDAAGKPSRYGVATWDVYELVLQASTNTSAWVVVDSGIFTIGVIPLVPFYTGQRQGLSYQFDPPLRTIAYMQIQEYQQESNLKNILEMTCFPMVTGDGVMPPEDNASIPVGPRAVLYGGVTPDGRPGVWKYMEPSGSSVKIVADQLAKTQNDMRDLGMQPLTQSNLTVITTGQVAVKANSVVQAWTIRFRDAIQQAWKITAMWMGNPGFEPTIKIHADFAAIMTDGTQMSSLLTMRGNGDLSRESIIEAAMRYDYLPSDFDIDDNEQELAEEQASLQPEVPIDPRTGQPLQLPGNGGAPRLPPPSPKQQLQ